MNEVLVIGGGIVGLAIALELKLQGAKVTVLSRNFQQAASHAAAGMLAPQAEAIPPGAMLELCLRSRELYPAWTGKLETITGLPTGYWACGILKPLYNPTDLSQLLHSSSHSTTAEWLDRDATYHHQPGLSAEVAGGWWYPKDAQVDNRILAITLSRAAQELGVEIQEGVAVEALVTTDDRVTQVQTNAGNWQADRYILATGAWLAELLSIAVYPKKGQMMSVRTPPGQALPLQQVLFGEEIYIVPRRDGRIVIGATSEDVGFMPDNTPAGVQTLLSRAIRLFPQLKDYPIEEFWWGFRPATADEAPVLGISPYTNLTLATGHYRNGILLAPVTAQLIANLVLHQQSDPLLQHFHYTRLIAA